MIIALRNGVLDVDRDHGRHGTLRLRTYYRVRRYSYMRSPRRRVLADIGTNAWEGFQMAKKTRGTRMAAAKKRAAKTPGGKGRIKDRKAGKTIMKT